MDTCRCAEADHCPLHAHFPEDEPAEIPTMSARIEMAAAMLLLEDPEQLTEALHDAGLGLVELPPGEAAAERRPFVLRAQELGGEPLLPLHVRAAQSRISHALFPYPGGSGGPGTSTAAVEPCHPECSQAGMKLAWLHEDALATRPDEDPCSICQRPWRQCVCVSR